MKTHRRTTGLIIIVFYKIFSAALLAVISVALFLAIKNSQSIANFSDEYALTGKREIIKLMLEKISNLNPRTLQFSAIATSIYAVVTAIEAYGLWYQKAWARVLVLVLVGIGVIPEIFELTKGISPVKLIVLAINLAVFWYLLRHSPTEDKAAN